MLPEANRLAKVRDFNLILKHGRYYKGQFLDLRLLELAKITPYFPKKEDPEEFVKQLRLALAVGLKVSKSAVKRNRTKRQLREVLRPLLKKNRIQNGLYLLFVARPQILEKDFAQISQETELLLAKAKVLI